MSKKIKKIVLFRDPRGIYSSRKKVEKNSFESVRKTCENYKNSLKFKGNVRNVLYVRYEDMAADKMKMAKKIYKFIEQPLPTEVINWIKKSEKKKSDGDRYSTNRNSTLTMTAWRNKISFQEVNIVYRSL